MPKFQVIILELAAVVFLFITAPIWLPIAGVLLAGGVVLAIAGFILLLLAGMCSQSHAESFILTNDLLEQSYNFWFILEQVTF
jgi:membrane-bound ClpP family serine protease